MMSIRTSCKPYLLVGQVDVQFTESKVISREESKELIIVFKGLVEVKWKAAFKVLGRARNYKIEPKSNQRSADSVGRWKEKPSSDHMCLGSIPVQKILHILGDEFILWRSR